MRDCLEDSGVIDVEQLLIDLHRRRFEAVKAISHWSPTAAIGQELAGEPATVLRIASHGGRDTLLALRAACRGFHTAIDREQTLVTCGGYLPLTGWDWPKSAEQWASSSSTWEPLPWMGVRRIGAAGAVLAGRIYVCGGYGPYGRTASQFNPVRRSWVVVPAMSTSRGEAAAAAVGQRLLIVGGAAERDKVLDTGEGFDPRGGDGAGCWTPMPSMREPRLKLAGAALGSKFVVCGGSSQQFCEWLDPSPATPVGPVERRDDSITASAACFDSEDGVWRALPPMLSPRAGHTASAMSGTVLVCGGSGLSTMEAFTLATGVWSALSPMRVPRSRHAAASSGQHVFVSGGFNEADFQVNCSVERFDFLTGTWALMDGMQLDLPRCNHSMVSIATTLIATPQKAYHMAWQPAQAAPATLTDVEPDEREMDEMNC